MRRLGLVFALLFAVIAPMGARADGDGSLAMSLRGTYAGGGVVSEGVGLATRTGGPAAGTIAIAGIPSGAQVEKALLYWAVLAGEDSSVDLNGSSVSGTRVGRSADTCWFDISAPSPANDNRTYRADVTPLVS